MSFSTDEVRFLTDNIERIDALSGELELTAASSFRDHRILREQVGDYARAVAELLDARRSAADKFPSHWLSDHESAQQATPMPVARFRAARLVRSGAQRVHDVTCSIGTEGAAYDSVEWIGSDRDLSRLLMARHNLGDTAWLAQADALHSVTQLGPGTVIVADPARRAGGRRITDPAKLQPPLPVLLATYAGQELAVKCAPGIDYSGWDGLVSVVSLDGAVKEACLYTPGLSEGITREAAVLRSNGTAEIITSADPDNIEVSEPSRYFIEPDGAIVRAGLVRAWAARHGLRMLDEHIAFLTGETIPPGCSGFPFIEAVPLRKLKATLKAHDAASVEILVRGVDSDPDQLRKKLGLRGSRQMAVIIARIGDSAVAYICGPREHASV